MSDYNAPVRDMLFVMQELAGLDRIAALPGCSEVNAELAAQVLEESARFSGTVLAPLNRSGDQEGARWHEGGRVSTPQGFQAAYAQFVAGGWNALQFPTEHGGQGLPRLVATPVMEMWKSANMAFSLCPLLTSGAVEALLLTGSPGQKRTYLPRMVEGRWSGTMNLTEPQAGSDLALLRTRAEPASHPEFGAHHRIHGQKIFITYGEQDLTENIVHLVLARTPGAPEGVRGISLFIVPKFLVKPDGSLGPRNDVYCASVEHKLGIHASPTAVLQYGSGAALSGVGEGAVGYLLGEENRGLEYMFIMMNAARFAVGLEGLAIAERAFQQALGYARERVQSRDVGGGAASVAIINHPDVRRLLLGMKARTEAMRALAYVVAAAADAARLHPDAAERKRQQAFVEFFIPVVKGWSTETAIGVASDGIQVHGGTGYIEDTGAAQHLRDARITAIYEGTTAIQANDLIGRKLARDGGATAKAVGAAMQQTLAELQQSGDAHCQAIGRRFAPALAAWAESATWIATHYAQDVRAVHAGSVPFLMLTGQVAGGWQMGRAALVAAARLAAGDAERAFHEAKLLTARFYADHVLTGAPGLRDTIIGGAAGLAIDNDQFQL